MKLFNGVIKAERRLLLFFRIVLTQFSTEPRPLDRVDGKNTFLYVCYTVYNSGVLENYRRLQASMNFISTLSPLFKHSFVPLICLRIYS